MDFPTVFVEEGHTAEHGCEATPTESSRDEQDDEVTGRYPHFFQFCLCFSSFSLDGLQPIVRPLY